MAKEYDFFYENSIFKIKNPKLNIDLGVSRCGIVSVDYDNSGYIECHVSVPTIDFKAGRFNISKIIKGRIWHQHGFGKCWELMVEIIEDRNPKNLVFQGGEFTKSFSSFSIASSIIDFFNEVQRFESIEDYKDFLIIRDKTCGDMEDEILKIGKVISLCKKYEEINPVFPFRDKLRAWIEKRMRVLISTK